MVSANLDELELHTGTIDGDPDVEAHFALPMFWATGNTSTAVLCVELEPGKSGPRHIDMPRRSCSSSAASSRSRSQTNARSAAPASSCSYRPWCPTRFANVGDVRARIVGFFPSNVVVAIADEVVQPVGGRVIGSPPPEHAGVL